MHTFPSFRDLFLSQVVSAVEDDEGMHTQIPFEAKVVFLSTVSAQRLAILESLSKSLSAVFQVLEPGNVNTLLPSSKETCLLLFPGKWYIHMPCF